MRDFPFEFDQTKSTLIYPPQDNANFQADILEVGPGHGDLLLHLAQNYPEKKFVAIEIGKKRFYKLIERIEKLGLKNILLLGGDARIILPENFTENSFDKIFVLFPDPWPKRKHAFRRLLNEKFIWLLSYYLKPQGELILGTDDDEYYQWIHERIQKIHWLENDLTPHPYQSQIPLPDMPQTYFEMKWREMGKTIYFLKYSKKK